MCAWKGTQFLKLINENHQRKSWVGSQPNLYLQLNELHFDNDRQLDIIALYEENLNWALIKEICKLESLNEGYNVSLVFGGLFLLSFKL